MSPSSPPSISTTPTGSATRPVRSPSRRPAIIKQDATVILAQQPVDAAQVLLKKAVEVDATVAREGLEFGVVSRAGRRRRAAADAARARRRVRRRSSCRCTARYQAHNAAVALAAVEAFFGVGTQRPEPLDIDTVRKAFAAVTLARAGWRSYGARPPSCSTPRTTRRAHGPRPRPSARPSTSAGSSAWSGRAATRTYAGCSKPSSRSSPRSSSHRTPAIARWTPTSWPRIAVEIFGDDRVQVEPRLDDALEAAITLAEEEGEFAGGGVLVTGSVITVGEARLLLGRG